MRHYYFVSAILILSIATFGFSQHEHDPAPPKDKDKQHTHPAEHMEHKHESEKEHSMNPASDFLMNQVAGTSLSPPSASMSMPMRKMGNWDFMSHGYVFLNGIYQTGPRGDDQFFSTNHLMLMGIRTLNQRSSLMLRGMLSLEPATISDRRYPLLFQTGETAFGEPLVDGQHPHDLFMELSVQYALQVNPDLLVHFYAAPRGDPALGPVAYPHRISAQELPQATLSHHLQDSTHILSDVLTAGLKYKWVRFELSGFHGAEPDEERWNLEQGPIDSWSTRITITPSDDWTAQISTSKLKKPEELEPGDIERTTASITYNRSMATGFWASSFIWGRNHKILQDLDVDSFLFETLWQFEHQNNLTGRIESVDKDELFGHHQSLTQQSEDDAAEVFRIKAFTFGYARDFQFVPSMQLGLGANMTLYSFPSELKPFYGNSPKTFLFYLRIRPGYSMNHHM